jgi:hypothetical protein
MRSLWPLVLVVSCASCAHEQVADATFRPAVEQPEFAPGTGPVVFVDEAHYNYHTASGRYRAFVELLEGDGYEVRPCDDPFSAEVLTEAQILVIANALHESDVNRWILPNPSAFTLGEIDAVFDWVEQGGSLMLIADHMPFPGAAEDLGAAFGFEFRNGFAMVPDHTGPDEFRRDDGSLAVHPITDGRMPRERVDQVLSFTGQAFVSPAEAEPLLILGDGFLSLEPEKAWVFDHRTRRVDAAGMHQGAVVTVGLGRVAVFGEAAMFTAQRAASHRAPMGLNAPGAERNAQLALNVAHWLSGLYD